MLKTAFLAALALVCVSSASHACTPTGDVMRPCAYQPDFMAGVRSIRVTMHRDRQTRTRRAPRVEAGPSQVVDHPAGCPRSAFCGCGAALHVFGHQVRELWLAAAWYKFPRSAPSPGMVAVRRHHVFVLEQHIGGDTWLAYDANSGKGLTRLHARSVAGYVIVNPHG